MVARVSIGFTVIHSPIMSVAEPLFVKVVVASVYAATSKSSQSFSGFSQTFSGRLQSLVP
jgi:hypothetical protein